MRKHRWAFCFLLGLVTILFVGRAQAMPASIHHLTWMVPLSGSGGTASSAAYTAQFTVGQTALGPSASTNYTGQLGYWYGLYADWYLYLPLALISATL